MEGIAGPLLLCGCCHAGLLNALAHVQCTFERPIVAVAGGAHLADASPDHLRRVGQALLEMEAVQRTAKTHRAFKLHEFRGVDLEDVARLKAIGIVTADQVYAPRPFTPQI
jgi:hypothetical protein